MNHRILVCALGVLAWTAGCESDDETPGAGGKKADGGGATGGKGATGGSGGTGGSAGSSGGSGGSGATGGTGGSGGSTGGVGGSAGAGGSAGGGAGADGSAGTGGSAGADAGADGSAGTGGNAGADGGSAGAAGSSACGAVTCGNAPYQCFDPVAFMSAAGQTDVTVSANICPSTTVVVPYQTQGSMRVERNTPFFFIGTQTNALTTFTTEYNVTVGLAPTLVALVGLYAPTYPATVDPAWDPATKAMIHAWVASSAQGATAPCIDKSGVTFAVTGHPEAVVKYAGGGSSTGTGSAQADITILTTGTVAAAAYVTVTGTKAGCVLGMSGADALFFTGRTPVARNVTTHFAGFQLRNP